MRQSKYLYAAALCLAALAIPCTASAQEATALPDPASVTAPDVYGVPNEQTVNTGHKYFFFYRADTDFAQAFADLQFCTQFTRTAGFMRLPGFAPWGETHRRPVPAAGPNPYGLVGMLIGSMVVGPLARGNYLTKMRRCMEPRGYTRYPMTEDAWNKVHEGDGRQSLLMQAKLASGIKPSFAEARQ